MGDHRWGPHDVMPYGTVHRIVAWLDRYRDAFTVSRLSLQTGVKLRSYGPTSPDDHRVMMKLWPALDSLLSYEEREVLLHVLRERPPPPPPPRGGNHDY